MTRFSRRDVMKAGAFALAAPAVLRAHDALASSGSVNVYAWGDYFDKNTLLADFTNASGVKVNLSTYGSNEEAENKLRAAGGKGFDVIFPSVDTGPNYYKDNLLQAIDEKKFKVAQVVPSIYRNSLTLGAAHRGKRYLVPFDWGTEGITWDSTKFDKKSGEISYGDLWLPGHDKQTAIRQKSVFNGVALYLDSTGELKSNRGLDLYKSEADARRVFDGCLKFITAHKGNIGAFWNNATEATAAFTDAGCTIGQTWDTTGILLNRKTDKKWSYGMPKEGGLAWTDTFGIPSGAENVEQAYALMNFLYEAPNGAKFANTTGYNTCANGAEKYLSDEARTAFEAAYPAGTIDNLFWWPMQTDFYAKLRGEYVEKLTNA
ncbi:extracellular solute-binding protein [Ancylobacter sp. 6x-1]|uniref:Extracellular solute-binding protein n=1 Tax=Ancylobacter crimeensis TaxID=2579147 RepID=A0ABT0DF51_9HYPH|nr:extracellular solute-binding protein [Ancylobacter crimeensis]MCK0198598.1 extracellular solute-binding protein [Ancylobacter crimeensis]